MFGLVETAFAQAAGAAAAPTLLEQFALPIGLFFIIYLFILRPQSKKAKEQQSFLAELKSGEEVVTAGGMIGRVKNVAEDFVTLDLGSTSVKVLKANLSKRMRVEKPAEK